MNDLQNDHKTPAHIAQEAFGLVLGGCLADIERVDKAFLLAVTLGIGALAAAWLLRGGYIDAIGAGISLAFATGYWAHYRALRMSALRRIRC